MSSKYLSIVFWKYRWQHSRKFLSKVWLISDIGTLKTIIETKVAKIAKPGVSVIIVLNDDPAIWDEVEWSGSELHTMAIINISNEYKISKYKKA